MKTKSVVLVVDDEHDIREVLDDYLTAKGFLVLQAEDGKTMREQLQQQPTDLVLLDINLPGEDGLSLARYLRDQFNSIGIIMVTGSGDVIDRVVGLEMGADDYIAKPFDLREVLARVKSVLRRYTTGQTASGKDIDQARIESNDVAAKKVTFGQYILDLEMDRLIDSAGQQVALTHLEFKLLKIFANRPHRVLSRDTILDLYQNREWDPYDRSIDIRITRLRRKIEPDPGNPQFIKTVRGVGYVFEPNQEN